VFELSLPAALLINCALLLSRMAAFVVFVPMPGVRASLASTKVVLGAALSAVAAPYAFSTIQPQDIASEGVPWLLLAAAVSEAALGAGLGVMLRLTLEAFGVAAQALGFQAGYSYVNMVDPTSQADASILNVMFALLADLLFLATDMHLFALRTLIDGLRVHPLGSFVVRPADAQMVIVLGGYMFEAAARLALPVMAVLLLIDLALGLLNQVHSRMQLITLSFSLKLVAATAVIAWMLPIAPKVFEVMAEHGAEAIVGLLAR
jgi:flagellar biosynthetic protein FliR